MLQKTVLTKGEVWNLATRCAAFFRDQGLKRGDVVCNTLPNSPERIITDLGLMVAGAVVLNGVVFLADGADLVKVHRGSQLCDRNAYAVDSFCLHVFPSSSTVRLPRRWC